jgi:DNA repair protein RecN (Recombination protein N)
MLTHLQIKNFTIIDELKLDFHSGMTVLTGETGAGKSIIIDSLELALGERADSNIVRHGCSRCEITAIFDLKMVSSLAQEWLKNHELETTEECIIHRIINIDGRSRSTINGTLFPQQLVRELGSLLVNIHGQHEHQHLLQRSKQLVLLDNYANNNNLCEAVKELYNAWLKATAELNKLENLDHKARLDLLTYQIEELNKLNLAANELEDLHQEYKQLANAEQISKTCDNVLTILDNHNFFEAQNQLSKIQEFAPQIESANKLLENALIQIDEAKHEIQHYANKIEINPERLQLVDERLNTIHNLARKHRIKPEELFIFHENLRHQLGELNHADTRLTELKQEIITITANYKKATEQLSDSRKQAAKQLAIEISKEMQKLNMTDGKLEIQFTSLPENSFSANGLEQIDILVSMNRGQPLLPLSKVASGGELSRLSLAIQVITAQKDKTPTLIFDEVDSGIGGKTAQIVGECLRKLGEKAQVLCVTHLPQVAAEAHHHFQVSKKHSQNATQTTIIELEPTAKVMEIARMLGGAEITPQTLAHAKEMCKK